MGFLSGFAFEGCSVTYVCFPGNHVCNQPGAVLLHELDLAAWRRFGEWASARGLQDLAGKGKATSTIRTAASAVSAAHRAAGFSGGNPSAHEDVKDFLRGVKRTGGSQEGDGHDPGRKGRKRPDTPFLAGKPQTSRVRG